MAKLPAEKWFADEVITGIQRLFVLSLKGTPAAETVTATAAVWIETLWEANIAWGRDGRLPSEPRLQEEDRLRISETFRILARECEYFPSPKLFLEKLPRRSLRQALPKPEISEAQQQRNVEKLQAVAASFRR